MIKSCVIGLSKVGIIHCKSLMKIKKTSLNYIFDKKLKLVGQIQIVKNKKNTLYFDSGEPPIYEYSKDYRCGHRQW